MNDLTIREATIADLPLVWEIVKGCAENYAKCGIKSWTGYTFEKITEKLNTGKILILENDKTVIGVASLSGVAPAYFYQNRCGENGGSLDFLNYYSKCENPVYLSMFGIKAGMQKSGYGSQFLEMVVTWSKENGYDAIRFDVNESIPGLIDFYAKRGFVKLPHAILNAGIKSWLMESARN